MFCLIYHYLLMTVDNTEFYDKQYPFSLPEVLFATVFVPREGTITGDAWLTTRGLTPYFSMLGLML